MMRYDTVERSVGNASDLLKVSLKPLIKRTHHTDGCVCFWAENDMKYIIMCGGPRSYKPLRVINNETIVERTIRLLRENGITDIAISTNDDRYQLDIPILSLIEL